MEHHFTVFSQLSATLNYVRYLAARTSIIRLGSAVVVPWHNPILLAEQVATIDQLSRVRYDFGVGRGYRANELHGFGIRMEDAGDIFEEAIALLKRSFTETDRWSYTSKRWQFNDIITEVHVLTKDKSMAAKAFSPVGNTGDTVAISEKGPIIGTPDEMAPRPQKIHDMGIRDVLLHDLPGSFEALRIFVEQGMPRFDGRQAQAAE